MENLENRLDRIEQHLTQLISMVANMAKETDQRFDRLEKRMDSLENRLDSFQKDSNEQFQKINSSIEYLALKWVQTDREVFYLKEQQQSK